MSSKRQQRHKSKALQFMTFEPQEIIAQRATIEKSFFKLRYCIEHQMRIKKE
ncbi:hypothetical protein D3C87_237700 [compost metagenome]